MLLIRRLYYHLKPFLPCRLRIALRRFHVRRILQQSNGDWPIKKGSERTPEGWPGWPAGKRFAVVLTHDVEGQRGVERVRQLAEVEMEFGFRSAFNFIPEGSYIVPTGLRSWLTERGFEVGVHDLHHDGKLYSSRDEFRQRAQRINFYLSDWNASGFRSGFMLHNLDWLGDLNIQYDASTFDTDPFEPQPDGVDTIFPFWVPRSNGASPDRHPARGGYIELPYTLPQDSTLFNFLQATTIDVWKHKLDWIARHGGMVLLNVHPDYVGFNGTSRDGVEFSAQRYRELLEYIRAQHRGNNWNALPKEVADYCEGFRPVRKSRRPKNICMLAYSAYEADARIVRYAQTLAKRGDHVDVVAYAESTEPLGRKEVDGVTLFKVERRVKRGKKSPMLHLLPLLKFAVIAGVFITRKHLRRRYDLIHVHNIPEWLVFAVCLPKALGARILLDIHDLVPELFAAKFKSRHRSLVVPFLKIIERASCKFADHVIISNHLWKERVVKRSVSEADCSVFFNNVDPDTFYPRTRARHDGRKIVLFPGSLQWHQGVDIAIRALPRVLKQWPTAEFHIYGEGGVIHDLKALVSKLGLQNKVFFLTPVPVNRIPQILADADVGIVPKRTDSFGNQAYSTKIMEFMSQGVPVVLSRTAIDTYYFDESQVRFCEPGNPESFAAGIIEVLTDEQLRDRLIRNSVAYVARNHWGTRKDDYLNLVDALIGTANLNDAFASPVKVGQQSTLSGDSQFVNHV